MGYENLADTLFPYNLQKLSLIKSLDSVIEASID